MNDLSPSSNQSPGRHGSPRGGHIWTSAEVARVFRVGVSSVKRWTDEGELEAMKTPGKHRRYTTAALYRFASLRGLSTDLLPPIREAQAQQLIAPRASVTLFDSLRKGDGEAVRRLLTPRMNDLAKRAAFFDRVIGDAMREIGDRWACGRLSVDEEHRASYMLAETLDSLRPAVPRDARNLALLACPPAESHDLPLRVLRLILEWRGWRTEYIGASTPWDALRHAVDSRKPKMLLLTARSGDPFRFTDFERFVQHASKRGVKVAVGGEWARGGIGQVDGYLRFRTLRGFVRWLRSDGADES